MGATIKKTNSIFFNHAFDKKRLKRLISWVFKKSGEAEALKVLDLLKKTGFQYATQAGISIGLHDLRTPLQKSWLISESQLAMNTTDRDFIGAKITATERSQRIIDTWHRASEGLSKQVVDYFGIYDQFNPVYIMALSGARGNFSQVRQLIGMRGLMADQQGKIVNFPIRSNLREGLTLTEYFISCSGARKGLVDTALRTADTGYLTRRLVDVSHHVVVKRIRCNTNRGITFKSLQSYNKVLLALKERLVGRVLAEDIEMPFYENKTPKLIAKKDQEISPKLSLKISQVRDKVCIRSPLTCGFTHSVCQLCYGWSISQGNLVSLGDAVGVIAAQSIGEPGTQLTMRTFHTGGVFSGDLLQEIRAPHAGEIRFSKAFQGLLIRSAHGRIAFFSKTQGILVLRNKNHFLVPKSPAPSLLDRARARAPAGQKGQKGQKEQKVYEKGQVSTKSSSAIVKKGNNFTEIPIQAFTMLFVRQGEKVEKNQLLAEYSIQNKEGNQPIKTQQTIFADLSGRVVEDSSGTVCTKSIKESSLLVDPFQETSSFCKSSSTTHLGISPRPLLALTRFAPFAPKGHGHGLVYEKYKENTNQKRLSDILHRRCVARFAPFAPQGHGHGRVFRHQVKRSSCFTTHRPADSMKIKLGPFRIPKGHEKGQALAKPVGARRFVSIGYFIPKPFSYTNPLVVSINSTNPRFARFCFAKRRFVSIGYLAIKPFSSTNPCPCPCGAKGAKRAKGAKEAKGVSINSTNPRFARFCFANRRFVSIGGKIPKNQPHNVQISPSFKKKDLENDVFTYIEPVRSGRLGFLKILSTRVGATLDYTCPIKLFDHTQAKRKKSNVRQLNYLHPEYRKETRFLLQSIAGYGDVVNELYKIVQPSPFRILTP